MIRQLNGIGVPAGRQAAGVTRPRGAADFRRTLEGTIRPQAQAEAPGAVRLSAHAEERLRMRNITLGPAEMDRISAAADKVASKGGRDALVVMEKVGLIVDVANRTVVTAIGRQQLSENVFTNIDSAVFA